MAGKVRSLTVSEGTELSGAPTLDPIPASEVSYNNISSGMTADNVQAAIDENDARHETHDAHEANMANPHGVDADDVGLGNVDNTSDANKPISTATQTALDGKLDDFPSTTDNALVRTDGVAGDTVQDTGILVDDSDNMSGVANLTLDGSIDKGSAAVLDIGSTNATTVNIGRTGQTTVVKGNLQVDGTTTTVNSETLDVADENITVNKGGNQLSADGSAGITVEMSDETDAVITYRQTSASKFQIGSVGSEVDIADISSEQILSNKRIYDLQLEYIPDGSTTGSNANVVAAPQTIRHFSNAGLVSVDTLAAGENGHTYVWVNKTGNPFTINNDAGANGFLTGTGANLVVEADASIWIQYDLPSTRWRVIGGSGAPSGGGGGGLEVEFKTTDFTAEAGKHYRCTDGVSAVTMPAITDGAQIAFSPSEGAEWSANAITITPDTGESIDEDNGAAVDEAYILNLSGVDVVKMTGKLSTSNWEVDTPVTPSTVGNGAIVEGWIPYTPSVIQNFPTGVTINFYYRRTGTAYDIRCEVPAGGITGGAQLGFSLPDGATADSSLISINAGNASNVGNCIYNDGAHDRHGFGRLVSTSFISLWKGLDGTNQPLNGTTIATRAFQYETANPIPITELKDGTTLTASDFSAKTKVVDNSVLQLSGNAGFSVDYAEAIAYRDSDNNYRLKFNTRYTQNSNTNADFSISGISFTNGAAIDAMSGTSITTYAWSRTEGPSSILVRFQGGETAVFASGDIPLDSKPTWFDDNAENNFNVDVHFQEATDTKLGLVKANKWQKIAISGSSSFAPGANVAQFNNLVIGKVYRITFAMNRQAGPTSFRTHIYPGSLGTTPYKTSDYGTVDSGDVGDYYKEYAVFTASSAVAIVAAQHNSGSAGSVTGFAWIEELNNYEPETTDFT